MKIAFITYQIQERYATGLTHDENESLFLYLKGKGLDIEKVIWNDSGVNWAQYDLAVLKSPWDYHEYFTAFCDWLDTIEAIGVKLLNPYDIIRWNSDKHYMLEIAAAGLPVIKSVAIEKNSTPELSVFFTKLNTQKLIIKPCISASAKHTHIVTPENVVAHQGLLYELLKEDSFLVQPFMEEILNGELSFIFIGGIYSHCAIKQPKSGDFRVQHFYGGTIHSYNPDEMLIAAAQKYVTQYAGGCLYARVDGLLVNGGFQLMELELIEPYLFLAQHAEAYQGYYDALLRAIKTVSKNEEAKDHPPIQLMMEAKNEDTASTEEFKQYLKEEEYLADL